MKYLLTALLLLTSQFSNADNDNWFDNIRSCLAKKKVLPSTEMSPLVNDSQDSEQRMDTNEKFQFKIPPNDNPENQPPNHTDQLFGLKLGSLADECLIHKTEVFGYPEKINCQNRKKGIYRIWYGQSNFDIDSAGKLIGISIHSNNAKTLTFKLGNKWLSFDGIKSPKNHKCFIKSFLPRSAFKYNNNKRHLTYNNKKNFKHSISFNKKKNICATSIWNYSIASIVGSTEILNEDNWFHTFTKCLANNGFLPPEKDFQFDSSLQTSDKNRLLPVTIMLPWDSDLHEKKELKLDIELLGIAFGNHVNTNIIEKFGKPEAINCQIKMREYYRLKYGYSYFDVDSNGEVVGILVHSKNAKNLKLADNLSFESDWNTVNTILSEYYNLYTVDQKDTTMIKYYNRENTFIYVAGFDENKLCSIEIMKNYSKD